MQTGNLQNNFETLRRLLVKINYDRPFDQIRYPPFVHNVKRF